MGAVTSFLLTELQMNTSYIVRVSSYGDTRFYDSNPASITVKTDYDGKEVVTIMLISCLNQLIGCNLFLIFK